MRIVVYGAGNLGALGFIAEGFLALGDQVWFREDRQAYKRKYVEADKFDLAITDGLRAPMDLMRDEYKEVGLPVLVTDLPYIRQNDEPFWQIGQYRLNWLPDFDCPADRLNSLPVELLPRKSGEYIVIAGQKPEDAQHYMDEVTLQHMYQQWVDEISLHTDRTIVFRPHPRCQAMRLEGVEHDIPTDKKNGGLPALLENAHCLVAYNSTSITEAIMAGVPCFAMGDAQALPLCNTDLSQIESPQFPSDPVRHQHFCRVAYSQWSAAELQSGEAVQFYKDKVI